MTPFFRKTEGAKRVSRKNTSSGSANKYRPYEEKLSQMTLLESQKAYGTKHRGMKKTGVD